MRTETTLSLRSKIGLQVRGWLQSDWGRPILAQTAALMSMKTRNHYTPTRYENGLWIHEGPDGIIVDRIVNFRETVSKQIANTEEQWFYQYLSLIHI